MKVLMFGWEFPPHISGGLGTACHGLAHAMVAEGVDVLFVVPRLTGDEVGADVKLISASDIVIPGDSGQVFSEATEKFSKQEVVTRAEGQTLTATSLIREEFMSPYNYGDVDFSVQHWNYALPGREETTTIARRAQDLNRFVIPGQGKTDKKYSFVGGYGLELMREVKQYAEVAEVLARENNYDVIHAHDWISFPAGIAAKKISGKPLVVHVHATEFDRSGEHVNDEVFKYEQAGMLAADRVLTVSQWTKDIVITKYNIPQEKVHVVYNGVVPRNNRPSSSFTSPVGSHIVTFLGRVTHQKGPFYFAEAARLVLQKFPDAHFVVAGSGDLLPSMIEFVARKKMSANFHFTGFVKGENVDRIWSVSDVYVMPSVSEPFGLTPLEAMQSGVPVIISKQSGVAEVMQNAIKIDFWNTRSLASAICSVLKYESLSKMLRENSVHEIGKINWTDSAKKIKHLYHELSKQPKETKGPDPVFSDSSTTTAG